MNIGLFLDHDVIVLLAWIFASCDLSFHRFGGENVSVFPEFHNFLRYKIPGVHVVRVLRMSQAGSGLPQTPNTVHCPINLELVHTF